MIQKYLAQRSQSLPASFNPQQLQITGSVPGVGPICNGPLGPGPCALVQQYILDHLGQIPQAIQAPLPNIASLKPEDIAQACAQRAKLDVSAFAICTGERVILPQNEQEILDCAVQSKETEDFATCAAPKFGYALTNDQRVVAAIADCAIKSNGDSSNFLSCTSTAVAGKQLTTDEQAVLDCARSSGDSSEFVSCATSNLLGAHATSDEKAIAACAMKSNGDSSDFLSCATAGIAGRELTPDEKAAVDCAQQSAGDSDDFASCAASNILGNHATREERIALQCAAQSDGDATQTAVCAGANMLNFQLNPEQQIAVQCLVSTGGQAYAAAGCIATRLTARELVKCVTNGIGTPEGCFGPNNDLTGQNGWTARTMGQLAGGSNSVIRNPNQIWGGDNSFVRNPGQIFGGSNSFVRNPSQIWGGPNSVFNKPSQLSPKPVTLVTVAGKRVCLPWC